MGTNIENIEILSKLKKLKNIEKCSNLVNERERSSRELDKILNLNSAKYYDHKLQYDKDFVKLMNSNKKRIFEGNKQKRQKRERKKIFLNY